MDQSQLKSLQSEWARVSGTHLRALFDTDQARFETFSASFDDLTIDYSKERLDGAAMDALMSLARDRGVEAARDAMFAGAHINSTEDRAVLHAALRATPADGYTVDGAKAADVVEPEKERFLAFADAVIAGKITAADGKPFTDVINIGIGGSDLGPVMVARALSPFRQASAPNVHFVSNVDGAHLADITRGLDPARTLVLIASKTFTTHETMTNAHAAQRWLTRGIGEDGVGAHLAALSTNLEATKAFGIEDAHVFGFWDWVGGRYSVWSAIGLSVALSVGGANFRAFLDGARAMDQHFLSAPLAQNLPILLALVGIWRRNAMGCDTVALIPYDQRLERFPAYVQQLDMESNGKSVNKAGDPVAAATGPVIWGEPGTNAQHSFFQLIHQGTDIIPVDFIAAAEDGSKLDGQHHILLANCFAQSQALAFGKTTQEVAVEMQAAGKEDAQIDALKTHRTFAGNRPSTTILHRRLDPFSLGRLIALFEHKVFVQGVIWDVNSFDQWGVELGKELAKALLPVVKGEASPDGVDGSTAGLIARVASLRD